jgi:LPXTG-site transpeptidase (sortase) family protein
MRIRLLAASAFIFAASGIFLLHDVSTPQVPLAVPVVRAVAVGDVPEEAVPDAVPAEIPDPPDVPPEVLANVATASPEPAPLALPTGAPIRLQIPGIGVDAVVEQVALAADGSMGVPRYPMHAAWYAVGPRPGEVGSAVMDGHVDWYGGKTGVFENLSVLKTGDAITVRIDDGTDVSFVVRETRTYDAHADSTDIFTSDDGKAHLNLITCNGVWDTGAGQYTERLVVFADKVE